MFPESEEPLNRKLFGADFRWGISSAAFQVEGGCDADGKGASIWDVFASRKGKILNGHDAKTACDFYNRYPDDIALVKEMNIPNFRFSLSWSRIIPGGTGSLNQKGIDYYNRIIDHCLEKDIEPWPTIYHWDLPHKLELSGGWTNRDVIGWFGEYSEVCAKHFGDRISKWMVMNEPMVFTGAGYFLGIHAPGRTGLANFLKAVHHSILSIGEATGILKDLLPAASVGTTLSCSLVEPFSQKTRDVNAAIRVDALLNRLFIEPLTGLGYPEADLPVLKKIRKYFYPGDEDRLACNLDFIGIQNYTREVVKYSMLTPYLRASIVPAKKRKVPLTSMGWEVYPESVYQMIKKFNAYSGIKKLYITESGAAFPDQLTNGAVGDKERTNYIKNVLGEVLRAKRDRLSIDGYFIWTLTDNFEWAEGYHPRFGLVYVDFETQARTMKDSGKWYRDFLADPG